MSEIVGTRKELAEKWAIEVYPIGPSEQDRERAIRAFMRLTRTKMVESIEHLIARGAARKAGR